MGEKYEIEISPAAARQLAKLPRPAQLKVLGCFESLGICPLPEGVEMLDSDPRLWRLRVGDCRVVYWLHDQQRRIIALVVRHREDAYRDLDKHDRSIVAKSLTPFPNGIAASVS
jgi:mRNA interferase RelE/StbE